MSDASNVEVTLTVQNNSEVEMGDVVDGYAADQAREYQEKAGEYAADALNSKNMAEAWAESDSAPAGEGTHSSKVWADTARQWAESISEPDGVSGARSSKTWAETARAWAESDAAPDGVSGAKSAKTWATISSQKAAEASTNAKAADTSAKASASSAAAAKMSQEGATTQATLARQSAESAGEKLAQMQIDLKVKADVDSPVLTGTPVAPTPGNNAQSTQIVNVAYVKQKIAELVNGSDVSLDTLKELADALGNDPNFATSIMAAIGKKLDATAMAQAALADGKGNNIAETYATKAEMTGETATLAAVAKSGRYKDLLELPTIPDKTSQLTNDSRFVATDEMGNVTLTGTLTAAKVYNAVYNDYAEFFPRGGDTQRGDIIALDETTGKEQYGRATSSSQCVVGVHTEDFASIIGGRTLSPGDDILKTNLPTYIPVALAGRVPVRMYGKARKGGWVIPSEMPGVGRMALPGESLTQTVGQIVREDTAENVRLVKIIVRSGR
ncbi:hypothetical protein SAMN05216495_11553 [Acidaminococcus fermentans]|uniref:Uncharacterized protein n=1 Tax=Acidaminococcus fermentans TaxID=905 RepID=A0A1H2ZLJ9_ACIFE|nr:hypothetical protein [Acidaminococcus fermentans]SDX18255.1 hypothetical protein SAMN05216495_11553 [Acidaminococcus fermentans]